MSGFIAAGAGQIQVPPISRWPNLVSAFALVGLGKHARPSKSGLRLISKQHLVDTSVVVTVGFDAANGVTHTPRPGLALVLGTLQVHCFKVYGWKHNMCVCMCMYKRQVLPAEGKTSEHGRH